MPVWSRQGAERLGGYHGGRGPGAPGMSEFIRARVSSRDRAVGQGFGTLGQLGVLCSGHEQRVQKLQVTTYELILMLYHISEVLNCSSSCTYDMYALTGTHLMWMYMCICPAPYTHMHTV